MSWVTTGDLRGSIAASAANQIAWQEASMRHLGLLGVEDGAAWTCALDAPAIWHTAIVRTTDHVAATASIAEHVASSAYVSVCDTWRSLDLEPLGLELRATGHWYRRRTGAWTDVQAPPDISIEVVRDAASLAAMERTMCVAFDAPIVPPAGSIHPPALLDDPGAVVVIARDGDEVVGAAMGQLAAGVLGIYGVGTVASHRRRGIAAALTATVGATQPHLDAVLQPSPAAASIYRRLGFERIGSFTHWQRPR